jgi:hypothetical protein
MSVLSNPASSGSASKLVVVVIPVHSMNPGKSELDAFRQCFKILKKYPIKVLAPEGLDLSNYKKVFPEFDTVFINPKWQKSVQGYNKLKLSLFFYDLFKDFDFLLTYELDAFIFSDDLESWCKKDYDYIGAPWFSGFEKPDSDKLVAVGNSGFSLRKISAMRRIISAIDFEELKYVKFYRKRYILNKINVFFRSFGVFFIKLFGNRANEQFRENLSIQNAIHIHEDWFIGVVVPEYFKDFRIAPVEEALKFSFEMKPRVLFEMNNHNLPMGCHAWERYDVDFWKPFIDGSNQ